jgi:hypothetical protein
MVVRIPGPSCVENRMILKTTAVDSAAFSAWCNATAM